MSQLHVKRLGYALGAEVTGIDLTAPLDDVTFAAIHTAWLAHLVLCFPRQNLTQAQFVAFAARFGEVEENRHLKTSDPENKYVTLLTNQPIDGRPWDGYKDGQNWHSDRSYRLNPTPATFVLAQELPEIGGDTMFANQYLAYETLSPAVKASVDELFAVHDHDNVTGTTLQGAEAMATMRHNFPPVVHPVVRVHPESGRKALYPGGDRARNFVGMTQPESQPLLDMLNKHAVTYEFTYRHRWRAHDLIMWDNRCLLHIALKDYDIQTQTRHLWRCNLTGPPTGRLLDEQQGAATAMRQG